jgi:putative glycosyltransferase (TIGR04372 family)
MLEKILAKLNKILIAKIARKLFQLFYAQSKLRFLNTNANAIGHLIGDVDCFLKERQLEVHSLTGVLLAPRRKSANDFVVKCWAMCPNLIIIRNPLLCYLMDYLRVFDDTSYDCAKYQAVYGKPAHQFKITNLWKGRSPVISLTEDIISDGASILNSVIENYNNEPIALLHCRDSFFDINTKNHNLESQKYRNCSIESYSKVIDYLHLKKFKVIRIGEYFSDTNAQNYISLERLSFQDKRLLECYLGGIHTLQIGSMSGPNYFSYAWNKPIFRINCLPYHNLRVSSAFGMAVPKLLERKGKIISIDKIFKEGIYAFNSDKQYEEQGIKILMNDADDILQDFKRFFDVYIVKNRTVKECFEEELQHKYLSLVPSNCYDNWSKSYVGPTHLLKLGLI